MQAWSPSTGADGGTSTQASPFLLENEANYLAWRAQKLADYPRSIAELQVAINNPYRLTPSEQHAVRRCCQRANMVIYELPAAVDKSALQALAAQMGLTRLDRTLCTEEDGISALQVATAGQVQDYIPYTNRPLNWHTDGYYNSESEAVQAVLLHCIRPAFAGGENQLLDHEMAYIQLRDKNPAFIAALMQPSVMTIPANVQNGVTLRPVYRGPVFAIDPQTGVLQMRYTARARHIVWQDDTVTREALAYLTSLFSEQSPFVFQNRLAAHQGLVCNNVLHNRTGFVDSTEPGQQRLLYRLRFYDRIH